MNNFFLRACLAGICLLALSGCSSIVSSATNGLSANLSSAILNQNDPATVRDGAPAFLLMLDSFVEGSPNDPAMLGAAAELYAAYGVLFVDDPERASRLTQRALGYGQRGLCASNSAACDIESKRFPDFKEGLQDLNKNDIDALYTYSIAWFAFIRANSSDMTAVAKLPRAEAALRRVNELDPTYREAKVAHYLGVLSTLRPPALGGQFEAGRDYYERSIELSGGKDLSVIVDYARFYARTLYEQELHDKLLKDVLQADPNQPGLTLFNTLAQQDAEQLLISGEDYF